MTRHIGNILVYKDQVLDQFMRKIEYFVDFLLYDLIK